MTTGRVRLLPPGTPGVPPPVRSVNGRYRDEEACMGSIDTEEVPDGHRWSGPADEGYIGFYCTRPPHAEDEPHICHLTDEDSCKLQVLIVWGGE